MGLDPPIPDPYPTVPVREGRKLLRVFSVTDGPSAAPENGNHFTLAFDPEDCRWRMWER